MKKILSFVLVLAMILGSVSFCFAEASIKTAYGWAADKAVFTDVTAADDCYEAVGFLKAIGAIDGTSGGRFEPNYVLTRAQIVAFVVKALGYPVTEGKAYKTQFADVPATAWYAGYVYWGTTLGVVEGRTATKFDPNAKVTADEATAFVLRVLGYTDDVKGGYPAGYIKAAYANNFYDVIQAGSATVTRGEVAQLFYEIVDNKNVEVNKTTGTATPVGNDYAILTNLKLQAASEFITMDDVKEVKEEVEAKEALVAEGFDLSKYIGAQGLIVGKTVKEKKESKFEYLAFYPYTTFVTGITGTTIKDGKIGGYEFDADCTLTPDKAVVNGYTRTDSEWKTKIDFKANATTPNTKKYSVYVDEETNLITGILAVVYDYVDGYVLVNTTNKLTAATTDATTGAVTKAAYFTGLYTELPMVEDAKGNKTTEIDYEELDVEFVGFEKFDDLKAGDLLAVYKKATDDIVKLEVYNNTIEGYIAKTEGEGAKAKYTINDKVYTMDLVNTPEKSIEYTFYLSKEDPTVIVAAVAKEAIKEATGLLVDSKYDSKTKTTTYTILSTDNKVVTITKAGKYEYKSTLGQIVKYTAVEGKLDGTFTPAMTATKYTVEDEAEVDVKFSAKATLTSGSAVINFKNATVFVYSPSDYVSGTQSKDVTKWAAVKGADLADFDAEKVVYTLKASESGYAEYALVVTDSAAVKNVYAVTKVYKLNEYRDTYAYEYTVLNFADGNSYTFKSDSEGLEVGDYAWTNPYNAELKDGSKISEFSSLDVEDFAANATFTTMAAYGYSVDNGILYSYASATDKDADTFELDLADEVLVYSYDSTTAVWSKVAETKLTDAKALTATEKLTAVDLDRDGYYDLFFIKELLINAQDD